MLGRVFLDGSAVGLPSIGSSPVIPSRPSTARSYLYFLAPAFLPHLKETPRSLYTSISSDQTSSRPTGLPLCVLASAGFWSTTACWCITSSARITCAQDPSSSSLKPGPQLTPLCRHPNDCRAPVLANLGHPNPSSRLKRRLPNLAAFPSSEATPSTPRPSTGLTTSYESRITSYLLLEVPFPDPPTLRLDPTSTSSATLSTLDPALKQRLVGLRHQVATPTTLD